MYRHADLSTFECAIYGCLIQALIFVISIYNQNSFSGFHTVTSTRPKCEHQLSDIIQFTERSTLQLKNAGIHCYHRHLHLLQQVEVFIMKRRAPLGDSYLSRTPMYFQKKRRFPLPFNDHRQKKLSTSIYYCWNLCIDYSNVIHFVKQSILVENSQILFDFFRYFHNYMQVNMYK